MTDPRKNPDFDRTAKGRVAWTPANVQRALNGRAYLGVHLCAMNDVPHASIRGARLRPLSEARTQRAIADLLISAGFEQPPKGRRPLEALA
jgi:hypothetical protein